jgi:predicted DNA-binding transcriptional regulator AlpA
MAKKTPELWNIRNLCAYFGRKRQTIHRWIKEGKLPEPIKKVRSPYWDPDELRASQSAARERFSPRSHKGMR